MTALVIFAKLPVAGKVKTRLVPALSPEAASRLYSAFIGYTLQKMTRIPDTTVYLAASPSAAHPYFDRLAGEYGVRLINQGTGCLGERLSRTVKTLCVLHKKIVITGSDSPSLPAAYIGEAFGLLENHDVVLGPAVDGGYYLVGQKGFFPQIYEDIRWSSSETLADTLLRVKEAGISHSLTPKWFDVDTPSDLEILRKSDPDFEEFYRTKF